MSIRPLRPLLSLAAALALATAAVPAAADDASLLMIDSQASMSYLSSMDGRRHESDSNLVQAQTPPAFPSLNFYGDTGYRQKTLTTRAGNRLLPQVAASACNKDPLKLDTMTVHLSAAKSSYAADYTAIETGLNTGIFVLQQPLSSRYWSAAARSTSDWHDVMPGDVITATAPACNGKTLTATLRMDVRAFVFDAVTGKPIAGVTVQLLDVSGEGNGGNAGGAADVFDADGTTPMPSTVVTDADGGYSFPVLRSSLYRLLVKTPATHTYPSGDTADGSDGWDSGYAIDPTASYGGTFRVTAESGSAVINVPVDPLPRGLLVQSSVSRTTAEIAETIEYAVSVKNVGQADLTNARLQERLPRGFRYVPGSARLDGKATPDPVGGVGPTLVWPIAAALPVAAEHTLRYRARIGATALQGDGIEHSQASAEAPDAVLSNVARTKVKVEAGVFSDRAIVLGTVYADCNANGLQDEGEAGIPGVRLWMEDGTSVMTDGAGRFSLYGLTPRTHVLKLDAITLPAGTTPLATTQRHAGDGASRFVDPRAGELQRADFALAGCGAALDTQIAARRQAARGADAEMAASLRTALTATPTAAPQDLRALPASGTIGASVKAAAPQAAASAPVAAAEAPAAAEDTALPRFIGAAEGQLVTAATSSLSVAGHLGAVLTLKLNGEPVGDDRIGERTQSPDEQIETRRYIGLPLRAGENRLLLQEHDAFGTLRATRELTLRLAGALARIVIETPAKADAGSTVPVRLRLLDAQGLPVDARLPVTLNLGPGRWSAEDLDPKTPELQTFVDGGEALLQWQAPDVPGEARLRAGSDGVTAEARLPVVAALRPLMAVGIVDAAFDLRRLKAGQVQSADSSDGFEQQLNNVASGSKTDVRGAVFLKGKVRGDALLTVAYDSDKSRDTSLFRDIQPDAFYPVYGDASEKGFDAQSTGRLYVRVDRGQSSLLYGDFTTQSDDPARQLGSYQRSLNGLKEHLQVDGLSANAWASHDSTRQMLVELPANGTSGPFALAGNMAANSETVEILVRDRNQPSLVLGTTTLTRFADYDIDPQSGRLLLRAPVASLDANMNPLSIRVTYEVEQGGPAFWVAGADAQWQATEALQLGGAYVRDWNPLATMQMGSANVRYQVAEHTTVSAEVAHIERGDQADGTAAHEGNAQRVEFKHDGQALKVNAHAVRSDVGFDNRSATINSGRSEAGAQATYMVDERTRVSGEALLSGDVSTGAKRAGVLVGVEHSLENGVKVELGARYVQQLGENAGAQADAAADGSTATVRAKVSAVVPGLPMATAFVEAEQDVRDADKHLLAIGGDYQLAGRGRLYMRHELVSSLTGPYALDATQRRNATLVGMDMGTTALGGGEGRVFSEYRGREAFDGRETEAAIGLRNQWQPAEGLRFNASLERVKTLQSAKNDNSSAAVTGAVEYTADPLWKGTARLELREGAGSTGLLSTLGLAVKLGERWTMLAKNVLAATLQHGAGTDRWQERLQLGAAYRTNDLNALGRYEYKDERGTLGDADARQAHIVSVHAERQLDRATELSGRYAVKHLTETVAGVATRTVAQLMSGRITRDIGERFDVGMNLGLMGDLRLRSRQLLIGAEAGYRVKDNMWVSLGYNLSGVRDRDLSADNSTQRGVYLRMRFKFDENLFSRLSS